MSEASSFDVAIVGGAVIGSAIAYFLKAVEAFPGSVALIERDPTFATAATTLSAASIRQQFSTPENIRLSRFGLEFLRAMPARFGPDADPALRERGYLILARPEGRTILEENHHIQLAESAAVALLDAEALAARFPWLSTAGIAGGSLGLSGEGWLDAHTLLRTLRAGAREAGATLLTGEVAGIDKTAGRVTGVRLADGRSIRCGVLVNAAGPSAGKVAALAGRALPVEPRKRSVFVLDAPDAPHDMPLLADPSGFWARPEGAGFLAGYSPPESDDAPADPADFAPDHAIFDEVLWPLLAERVPAFERLKVTGAWAGHYDYNALDQNAVIGPDPELPNFFYANGFSGHGLQHAPGVGRALAELIARGRYSSLDLSVFGYERIAAGRPLFERNVI
jgi:FAD-dependent oxidoreductase domain-containing protein 1